MGRQPDEEATAIDTAVTEDFSRRFAPGVDGSE
jgi:hypothetical protein